MSEFKGEVIKTISMKEPKMAIDISSGFSGFYYIFIETPKGQNEIHKVFVSPQEGKY